ncbi:MAG: response regulator [Patescibacteria group bacterium]
MKKILLVEDDPFLLDIYKTKFQEEGFSVQVAEDGEKALKMVGEDMPDILLLDIVLPSMDGFEFLKEIKSNDKLKNIRIVLLSNLGQKNEVEKGVALGADKYLIKAHYTPSEVVKEIKKILK